MARFRKTKRKKGSFFCSQLELAVLLAFRCEKRKRSPSPFAFLSRRTKKGVHRRKRPFKIQHTKFHTLFLVGRGYGTDGTTRKRRTHSQSTKISKKEPKDERTTSTPWAAQDLGPSNQPSLHQARKDEAKPDQDSQEGNNERI
jgi:hypothetical protein